jgi:hypothetical protein
MGSDGQRRRQLANSRGVGDPLYNYRNSWWKYSAPMLVTLQIRH